MRILLLTSVFPTPHSPTKGAFNASLVAGLRAAGDDVRVIAPVPWTDHLRAPTQRVRSDGISHPTWFYPPRIGHATHHRWMRMTVLPAARTAAEGWSLELVVGYWTHPDGTVALELARQLGVPGVLIVGGSDIQLLTADPGRRRVILETLLSADRVLTIGAPLRDRVIALGVPDERVGVLSRGVNRERFHPGDGASARRRLGLPLDRPIALWVGRMVPVKGLDLLIAAWKSVKSSGPSPLLLLAGDGQERHSLEAMATSLGGTVRFVGNVANADLPDWYGAADIVVLPSRSEGVPNVLLEGLACGTPFVASEVGAISELLEPNSRVVPPGDVAALSVALNEVLASPPLTRRAQSHHIPDSRDGIAALRTALRGVVETARPMSGLT